MWRALLLVIGILAAPSVFAVNSITISAETVRYDKQATLEHAELVVDLNANTTALLKVKHLSYQDIEAQHTELKVDLGGKPRLNATTQLKQQKDKDWAKAQFSCLLPAALFQNGHAQQVWHCEQGNIEAKGLKLPFSMQLTQFNQ